MSSQGQALTQFARVGPAMYQHCEGSALGATLRGKTALVSLSQYLSGWGSGSSLADAPLCLSTLAHVIFQPWENSVFSLSAVNRFWPSPPLPSFRGLHWSEMGPLVLSKTRHAHKSGSTSPQMSSSPRGLRTSMDNASLRDFRTSSFGTPSGMSNIASWGTPYGEAERTIDTVPETHGSAIQSIALAGEIDVGANVSLAGWAQVSTAAYLRLFFLLLCLVTFNLFFSVLRRGSVSDYVCNRFMYSPCFRPTEGIGSMSPRRKKLNGV